jgi:hypothetical protein
MVGRIQRHWREFRVSTLGRRFEQRYNRRRQDERSRITIIYVGYLLLFSGSLF